MQHSRSPSNTELVAAAMLALAVAACSDDTSTTCGPGTTPAAGITLTIGAETIT